MRFKDGKQHRYWSIVANRRVADGRVVQRQGLSLGERNASQTAAWCQAIGSLGRGRGGVGTARLVCRKTARYRFWSAMWCKSG